MKQPRQKRPFRVPLYGKCPEKENHKDKKSRETDRKAAPQAGGMGVLGKYEKCLPNGWVELGSKWNYLYEFKVTLG